MTNQITMTQDQAAKYLVVAWVKGWSLRMYFRTVGGADVAWKDAHTLFQWLPISISPFVLNQSVRRYIADNFKKLNDKLWDAQDSAQRLTLAPQIMQCNGNDATIQADKERKAYYGSKKEFRNASQVYHASVEAMRKGNGSHWQVCK